MKQQLESQADRIEHTLAMHNVPAKVTGGTVTPRWIRFQVLPAVGAKISKIRGLNEEIAAGLNVPNCRVSRRGAAISIEVPRDDPQPVRFVPLYRQLTEQDNFLTAAKVTITDQYNRPIPSPPPTPTSIPPVTAILGLAEDGTPLLIRLPSPEVAHILVAGTTGSGKTVLLQTMVLSLAMINRPNALTFVLIDPKGTALSPFSDLPHLICPPIREVDQTAKALNDLVQLMVRRGLEGATYRTARIVVVIDELADLLMVGGKAVQGALTRLTQRGREVGIHIVAATQKPTSAVLGPLIKANFPVRLVGRVTSVEDARTASGWSGTGAERLTGRGDFLAVAEGRVTRFQVAHVSVDEIREMVGGMPGSGRVLFSHEKVTPTIEAVRPIATILPPATATDGGNGKITTHGPSTDQELVTRLTQSDLWPQRRHPLHYDDYKWGFLSAVSRLLFEQPLAGTFHARTLRVVRMAEEMSQ